MTTKFDNKAILVADLQKKATIDIPMDMGFENKAVLIAKLQREMTPFIFSEIIDYSNKTMMAAEIKQYFEISTNVNSEVEVDALQSPYRDINVSNRVLICLQNEEFLLKRRKLLTKRHHKILTESNSALITKRESKEEITRRLRKSIDDSLAKNKDIVDAKILDILLRGEEAMA